MKTGLIYHTQDSASGGKSPFAKAISEIIEGESVKIACPYLSLKYIEHFFNQTNSLQLLTDINQWCNSSFDEREQLQSFFEKEHENIKHLDGLHMKLILSGRGALIGSANLTERGIKHNHELGYCIKAAKQLEELNMLFDSLWEQAIEIDVEETIGKIGSLPTLKPQQEAIIAHSGRAINSSDDLISAKAWDEEAYEVFCKTLIQNDVPISNHTKGCLKEALQTLLDDNQFHIDDKNVRSGFKSVSM